ncbi:two-component sensor histidine kinase [Paenibacillus odorifer]|uniref:Two-component sensor histidine kinase n=2 Tax=Paenibacillus TaxID=44249 RepID=A0A1R0Z817_9BACL|nr:sensor histidine kinase [Paenibacillus odorifer]KAA1191662.1 sensor histidine kinase [Paenibacillus sp. B2(2019)]OME64236.1 two-component sensor histidine kinase [Paenibacillus odorifer]
MYARIITLMNNLRLRTKLFLSFGCVVLIPVLIVGLFLTNELRNMAMANALEQITANVDRVKKRTGEMLNIPLDIAYRLSNDSRLEEVANHRYESVYDVVEAYWNYPDFRDFVRLYNEVSSIRLYIDNPTVLNNWEFLQTNESVTQEQWYQTALAQRGLVCWNYIRDNRNGQYYLSLIRKVNFFKARTTGVLVVNVNTKKLNAILNQESFETLIMDENDNIVASNRVDTQDKSLSNIDLATLSATGQGPHDVTIDGKPFKMVIDHWQPGGSLNSLRIISIFSVASIVDEPNRIIFLASIVILSAMIMAILLIYYVSRLLTGRMLHLSKHISKVAAGNLGATLVIDGKDEIGQLARQFNHMVRNINELMSEVQESNRQKNATQLKQNEIKFKMMASQINPHFLFNALESIRMKALVRGQADISQVVRLLGKMMRKNLEVGNGRISLQSELETVNSYLVIQKFRYDDRLTYELLVDPKANPFQIPPLIIQPLVENCVIHGLENRIEGGMVRVEIRLEDSYLKVQVSDNGVGISKTRIQEIRKMLNNNDDYETNNIGMRNIHLRLQLTYGPQFGLTLASQIGFGTQISFAIPLRSDSYV